MNGLFLVLEGMDGAGKSSQLALLSEFFRKAGRTVKTIHFPRANTKPFGEMVAAYLRGEYGDIASVHPKLSALLFALDRQQAAPGIRAAVGDGYVVLADRYLVSNIVYQRAKLKQPGERDEIADWLENLEYGHLNIPRPDLTLFLDVPPAFSLARLGGAREGTDRDYLRGRRDIHEQDAAFQERVREEYLEYAKKNVREIGTVDCRDLGGGMADKAAIHSRILDALRYYRIV